ncbi:MAG: cupin domain-containing protein [Candidatus Thorarchaeota archaeon]
MTQGNLFENLVFSSKGPDAKPLAQTAKYKIMRIVLGKGAQIPPHEANHSAFFLVLKGRAIITNGDEKVELGQDQFIAMEANKMRGIQALEDLVILGVRD